MKIRALANGNVIEADEEAAKQLIDAKIYEAVVDDEPLSSEVTNEEAEKKADTPAQTIKRHKPR